MKREKELVKNAISTVSAGGAGIGAVAATGIPGLSAVGISTGLATLGLGSMAIGLGTVGVVGVGAFFGAKKLLTVIFD